MLASFRSIQGTFTQAYRGKSRKSNTVGSEKAIIDDPEGASDMPKVVMMYFQFNAPSYATNLKSVIRTNLTILRIICSKFSHTRKSNVQKKDVLHPIDESTSLFLNIKNYKSLKSI